MRNLPHLGRGNVRARARPPDEQADYRVYTLSVGEWIWFGSQGAAIAAILSYVFYRSLLAFFFLLPLAGIYPLYKKRELIRRRQRAMSLELKDALTVFSSFLGAGYSVENALSKVGKELILLHGEESVMGAEFLAIAGRLSLNETPESLLLDLGERSGMDDIVSFSQVFAAAKRSGGNLVEVIAHTAGVIRDKVQVQEEIHTMTAAKAFEQKVMNVVPVAIALYIDWTSPGFFDIMYETGLGRMVMSGCIAVYVAAIVLSEKILSVEV